MFARNMGNGPVQAIGCSYILGVFGLAVEATVDMSNGIFGGSLVIIAALNVLRCNDKVLWFAMLCWLPFPAMAFIWLFIYLSFPEALSNSPFPMGAAVLLLFTAMLTSLVSIKHPRNGIAISFLIQVMIVVTVNMRFHL